MSADSAADGGRSGDQVSPPDKCAANGAFLSSCGVYRYWLWRSWVGPRVVMLPFIMLNPSTADASEDDPTIRRCIGFARREGFSGISIFNLFALRATDPAELRKARDPVGPENDGYLRNLFISADLCGVPVIAAWGVHGKLNDRAARVRRVAREAGVVLNCLGKTKDGHPKHPLYLPADAPIIPLDASPSGGAGGDPRPLRQAPSEQEGGRR